MYKTTDLYLAAYLVAVGAKIVDVESDARNPKKKTFVFKDDEDEMKAHVMAYYGDDGLVPARAFVNAIKDMKSLTHNT